MIANHPGKCKRIPIPTSPTSCTVTLGDKGNNECPAGSVDYTEAQCAALGTQMFGSLRSGYGAKSGDYKGGMSDSGFPTGCWASDKDVGYYYNRATSSTPASNYFKVCSKCATDSSKQRCAACVWTSIRIPSVCVRMILHTIHIVHGTSCTGTVHIVHGTSYTGTVHIVHGTSYTDAVRIVHGTSYMVHRTLAHMDTFVSAPRYGRVRAWVRTRPHGRVRTWVRTHPYPGPDASGSGCGRVRTQARTRPYGPVRIQVRTRPDLGADTESVSMGPYMGARAIWPYGHMARVNLRQTCGKPGARETPLGTSEK